MRYAFDIGDCGICFQTSVEQEMEEQFHPFVLEGEGQSNICFIPVEHIDESVGEDLVTEEDAMYSEYLVNGEYIRTFHGTGTKKPYAVLRKNGENEWKCSYLKAYEKYFKSIGNCFGHIAMERILMEQEAAILHASFIEYEGKAILFTGPSGIGKSTQAGLWEQYEDAQVLNGDRTILRKKEGIWYAYGSPYAGSSRIYRNRCVPIRAIVSLEQSPDTDNCSRVMPGKAFSVLYSGLTLNTWNKQYMEKALNMIQEICLTVPVFHLKCRPEQTAVTCLKQVLEKL